jgi:pimeloyl-ACP methyl ester carboxylesterase|tara:strand:+ start:13265 stop:14068 length:804 start_codon:yes stop_codon:yes gene_type:complete
MTARNYITTSEGIKLAFVVSQGTLNQELGIVFLGGFMSDMTGEKATAIEKWAIAEGYSFLRFDYSGHGLSEGDIRDGTISRWTEDSLTIIRHVSESVRGFNGPLMLIGSSMGSWIMFRVADKLERSSSRQKAVALIGVGSAPDFTYDLLPDSLGPNLMSDLSKFGFCEIESEYSDQPYIITNKMIEDGNRNRILNSLIKLNIPVSLIHGQDDKDVPWTQSLKLMDKLTSSDAELILIKGGDHRLSDKESLQRIISVVENRIQKIKRY